MIEFAGRWELAAAVTEDLTDPRFDDEGLLVVGTHRLPPGDFARRWLGGAAFTEEPPLEPLTGLTMTIADDGTFTEKGAADVAWFDVEGALCGAAEPFDGTLAGTFLLSAAGAQTGEFADATDLRLRLDDGETAIGDLVAVDGDGLLRTMSMISDGVYANRVRLAYRRA